MVSTAAIWTERNFGVPGANLIAGHINMITLEDDIVGIAMWPKIE